ncbi:MAG: DNA gyrase/topoisomerase IV subunit A [Clostridium chrysemydis]|uniref:DNA gyrase/topoisomerase IV subunit A n=1 Tax=Clostridium chrysemydis TaxID=2665504 RepID=UPI003F33AB10
MGKVIQENLVNIMEKSYVDYAKDVIEDRALPNVADGLKPVHRRILYGLFLLGLVPDKSYKKCARIVGEVLGKFHPHGDSSVYDALVRMAQDFSMRYPLVDGHGNFGSVDGDSAAAMRYTEAKMNKIAPLMLQGINRNTVNFIPNFDGEEEEPEVLPSIFPNLLVNGSSGIAVGMATNMPPHNLGEVIDGISYRLEHPNCTLDEIMQFIKAPDFPTGGIITNKKAIKNIYETGKGKIIIRAKHHIETIKEDGKEIEAIIVTELPYQVNKAKLIEVIDDISKDREIVKESKGKKEKLKIKAKIPEIADVRDESDRDGMRIVIELKKKGESKRILQLLYKNTKMQDSFGVNNVALVKKVPHFNLSLMQLIDYYIDHRKEVIIRESKFDKEKYENKLHILVGLTIALDKMDLTISLIRKSKTKAEAKERLKQKLNIDDIQADAILQMQLQRLTNLEKDSIYKQVENLNEDIKFLKSILENESILINELIKDLEEIKNKFGDERRTQLIEGEIIDDDMLVEQYNTIIQLTKEGYIKKLRATSVKSTNKNRFKEGDSIIKEIKGNNVDTILLFSNKGNTYKIKAKDLRELKPGELGELISSYHELDKDESIKFIISTQFDKDEYMISVFENGKIAKVDIQAYNMTTRKFKYNANGIVNISNIHKDKDIFLLSNEGKALVCNTDRIGSKASRNTQGNIGIKLNEGFKVVAAIIDVTKDDRFTIHTEKGKEIRVLLDDISPKEDTMWFDYLRGRAGNMGNFFYNTRAKNDLISNVEVD